MTKAAEKGRNQPTELTWHPRSCPDVLFPWTRSTYCPVSLRGPYCNDKRNVLFNDALNTFYLRLYGVRHG